MKSVDGNNCCAVVLKYYKRNMLLKIILIPLFFFGSTIAEGPYASAGWRPNRPFNLPTDYLPPTRDIENQEEQPTYFIEINKQRVDFAGQIQNSIPSSANRQPYNTYFVPRKQNTNFLKEQRPPYKKPAPQFILHSFGPRPQNEQKTKIFQISNTSPQSKQFGIRQQSSISQPAQTYGPPSDEGHKFSINYQDPQQANDDVDELDEGARIAIETLNAARDAYNRQQEEESFNKDENNEAEADVQEVDADGGYPASRATRGQYYVLGPDNRFQLVRFTTAQSEEEAKTNGGFSAQLRYTPVGEINDPIYKSDSRGQLVRIFKK